MSPIPTFTGLPPHATFEDVVRKMNVFANELRNIMLNMDSINVVSLTADHIDAGTIDANVVTIRSDLSGAAYVQIDGNGMVINNGSFNTFTANTNGAVTMTSALIQSTTGFPRVVMDPTGNLFGAYHDALNYISIIPNFSTTNTPALQFFRSGTLQGTMAMLLGGLEVRVPGGGNFYVSGGSLFVDNVSNITDGINTIGLLLNAKAAVSVQTGGAGSHNHGIPAGATWTTSAGTATWAPASNHTHTQN
jgi:hypothetical protein